MQYRGLTSVLAGLFVCAISHFAFAQAAGNAARSTELYDVQCGVLSSEGLRDRAKPRFSSSNCRLTLAALEDGLSKFDFAGTSQGEKLKWSFVGNTKTNVFRQLEPQEGGKFNRRARADLACFVPFDIEGLDDVESLVCYRSATLRKVQGTAGGSALQNPVSCNERCKQQSAVLSDLDANTSIRLIEQAFGVPVKEAKGKQFSITTYRGVLADLHILQATDTMKRLAFSVVAKDFNPAVARYLPTPLLWRTEPRVLGQATMDMALDSCSGDVSHASQKHSLAWTPACYFGGPGSYKYYSFLFYMNGADCDKYIDDAPFKFEKLDCKNRKGALPAVGEFVAIEIQSVQPGDVEAEFSAMLRAISDFVFWGAVKS